MTKWSVVVCALAVLFVLSISFLSGCSVPGSSERQNPLTAEDVLVLSDELEFAAIQAIHRQLDDNADGKVDLSESEEFVQTELCQESGSSEPQRVCFSSEKSQRFHQTDKHITSMELWMTWHTNEVFNWTTDNVVCWLTNHVHLPQYEETFRRHKITGRLLPKIATNSGQILQSVLLIADSQHRQKIQLRAMDVILFGPPRTSGYWKDVIVALSIMLCCGGVLYALRQRWIMQSRIDSFLEEYRMKEEELTKLRSKLEQQEMVMPEDATDSGKDEGKESPPNGPTCLTHQDSSPQDDDLLSEVSFSRSSSLQDPETSLLRAHEEIEVLHRKIQSLECQLDSTQSNLGLLQGLLQESCRREWEHLEVRKRTAEEQMTKAEKVCEKIKKRRSSLFGSLHLANSSALEEAGLQITKAVNKMQSMSEYFDEYHKRWRHVENICGFQVCSSPNSPTHHRTPSQALNKYDHTYMSTGSDSSSNSLSSFSGFDGISLRQQGGAKLGEDVNQGLVMHRSSTLPHFRSKSLSLSEADYYPSKSRSSSISSTASSLGSTYLPRSFKSGSPFNKRPSLDGSADLELPDSYPLVSSQHLSSQIQHHQLHRSSVGSSSSSKKPSGEVDIAELKQSPKHCRKELLKSSASVPSLIAQKDSYSEAIVNREDNSSAFVEGESGGGEGGGGRGGEVGVMFSISDDTPSSKGVAISTTSSNSVVSAKSLTPQSPSEVKQSLKPPSYRTAASNGLEAIKEERTSQISLSLSSGSSNGSGSRAGSASPDKPKPKRTSRNGSLKSSSTINHRAISSDV